MNDVNWTQLPQLDSQSQFPLFSVIVPFEEHRGQWQQCIRAWHAQTLPGSEFELILVVPPSFSAAARSMLPALLRAQDRIEHTEKSHDIALCAVGAKLALGQFLFFTEAHCWPEPDVLERCLKKFVNEPDLAGFSCRSLRVTQGRLSNAEADMYEPHIEGMTVHPWRKILDQCFATRRDCYEESRGFNEEYGHCSEWVLAANYFALGYKVGYEHDARVHHYYDGDLASLREFTRSFADGEIRLFAQRRSEPGSYLFEQPPEWIDQGRWNRRLARGLAHIALLRVFAPSIGSLVERLRWAAISARWLALAILGATVPRAVAVWHILLAYVRLRYANIMSSQASLNAALRTYISTLAHHQRIASIKAFAGAHHRGRTEVPEFEPAGWNPLAPDNAGFYPAETYQGHKFRWSESAAIMEGWIPIGWHEVCIDCLPVRPLNSSLDVRFYFNQQLIPIEDIWVGPSRITIRIDVTASGWSTLAWTCRALPAFDDPRLLGLPIRHIDYAKPGR